MTALPETMPLVTIEGKGGPEVLRLVEGPVPQPGARQVLIKVAAAGVNRPDVVQRLGLYPAPKGHSEVPGLEVAGHVAACGAEARRFAAGVPVMALVNGGGYAGYCLADEGACLPVPDGLSMTEAAGLPETFFTVWHNVFERGYARDGEVMLVHGGTSGIGSMAIMLGRAFGLQVLVTCGGPEKCTAAREIGAVLAIDYKAEDFVEAVKSFTNGKGVQLVLDMVAGDYVARNMKCLSDDGRHVTIAVQGGVRAEINMAEVMRRRLTLTGSTLRPRSDDFKTMLADDIARNAWPLIENGTIRPVMDQTFALADAAAAHARMEAGEHIGKIVLQVSG